MASAALSLRKARGLRVRLPLARLTVAATDAATLQPFADILGDEVNVKDVVLTDDVAAYGRFEVAVNARACGPRLGGDTQKVIRAVKAGEWTANRTAPSRRAGSRCWPGSSPRGSSSPTRRNRRPARQHRPGGAGHGRDARAGPGGSGPRRGPARPAGPPGRRSGGVGPDHADPGRTRAGGRRRARARDVRRRRGAGDVVDYAPAPEPTLVGTVSDGHEVRVLVTPARPLTAPRWPAAHARRSYRASAFRREELPVEVGLPLAPAGSMVNSVPAMTLVASVLRRRHPRPRTPRR